MDPVLSAHDVGLRRPARLRLSWVGEDDETDGTIGKAVGVLLARFRPRELSIARAHFEPTGLPGERSHVTLGDAAELSDESSLVWVAARDLLGVRIACPPAASLAAPWVVLDHEGRLRAGRWREAPNHHDWRTGWLDPDTPAGWGFDATVPALGTVELEWTPGPFVNDARPDTFVLRGVELGAWRRLDRAFDERLRSELLALGFESD